MTRSDPSPTTDDSFGTALEAALANQFIIEREIGRGGMGVVYLARDTRLERPVAIKVLPRDLAGDPILRQRFLREARTAGQLSHPYIVPIYRADEVQGLVFFVMAYIEGETLGARVRERGPLPAAEAVRHLREAAWALAYAHARGVVHRDVKPENIMVERASGRTMVTDFGIARDTHSVSTTPLTESGQLLGTVQYMSPEQANGEELDGRSDLFALGVVGFYVLSGQLPFPGSTAAATLVALMSKPAPRLATVIPAGARVPAAVSEVIDRCLAKDRALRYANGEALADALGLALEGEPDDLLGRLIPHRPVVAISEGRAASVWRRAAQLQADAAHRLEREAMRSDHPPDGRRPGTGAALGVGPGYTLEQIEAAAVEAGISQRYVTLALSELAADAPAMANENWRDRAGAFIMRPRTRSIRVSRVIRHPPGQVFQAIGRVLQAAPYDLTLVDTVGGHPLDGGVMVFTIPTGVLGPWASLRLYAGMTQVRVTLSHLPARDAGTVNTEVGAEVDLRHGIRSHGMGAMTFGSLTSTLGALGFGGLAASKALSLLLVAGAGVGGAAALGFGGLVFMGAMFRQGLRQVEVELARGLDAVDGHLRSRAIFGDLPPAQSAAPSAPGHGPIIIVP